MRIFIFLLLLFTNIAFSQRTILHCGQLIDVKTNTILKEMSIIVEGNKIIDVQKGYIVAEQMTRSLI